MAMSGGEAIKLLIIQSNSGYTSDTPALKIGNEGEQTLLVHEDVLPLI